MKRFISPSLLWMGLICAGSSFALTTNSSMTPQQLANTILGEGVTISNVSYTGADAAAGIFNDGNSSVGFESGIVLSSGNIANVLGPNTNDGVSAVNATPGDADLNALVPGHSTYDAAVLEFDFVVDVLPDGLLEATSVTFQYVFTSDEYNEYVNTSYNDVFGFFVNGNNVALIPGTAIPVAINTINSGNPYIAGSTSTSIYYRNNDLSDGGGSIDTQMDGLTIVLNTQFDVIPGELNHIKLAIADAGDVYLDSNVFIRAGSFHAGLIDTDQDGIVDIQDNCPLVSNPDQEDLDNDGFGNLCDNDLSISLDKITGGGAVMSVPVGDEQATHPVSFGFKVSREPLGIMVHLEYNDHIKAVSTGIVSSLQIKIDGYASSVNEVPNGIEFNIPCSVRKLEPDNNRELNYCHVRVQDNAQPGTGNLAKGIPADEFHLDVISGPQAPYSSGAVEIIRGNIKVH